MRNSYRLPLAGIVLMVLICVVIAVIFSKVGAFVPFGHTVLLLFAVAAAAAIATVLVLTALRRSGPERLSKVRTWPQRDTD